MLKGVLFLLMISLSFSDALPVQDLRNLLKNQDNFAKNNLNEFKSQSRSGKSINAFLNQLLIFIESIENKNNQAKQSLLSLIHLYNKYITGSNPESKLNLEAVVLSNDDYIVASQLSVSSLNAILSTNKRKNSVTNNNLYFIYQNLNNAMTDLQSVAKQVIVLTKEINELVLKGNDVFDHQIKVRIMKLKSLSNQNKYISETTEAKIKIQEIIMSSPSKRSRKTWDHVVVPKPFIEGRDINHGTPESSGVKNENWKNIVDNELFSDGENVNVDYNNIMNSDHYNSESKRMTWGPVVDLKPFVEEREPGQESKTETENEMIIENEIKYIQMDSLLTKN